MPKLLIPLGVIVIALISAGICLYLTRNNRPSYHRPARRPKDVVDYLQNTILSVLNNSGYPSVDIEEDEGYIYISIFSKSLKLIPNETPRKFPESQPFGSANDVCSWVGNCIREATDDRNLAIVCEENGSMQVADGFGTWIELSF